jgi:NAD+ synthase (glutamine-hydrolysing)
VNFDSVYDQGFVRVAAVTVPVSVADPAANAASVVDQARECAEEGVGLALFPELCLTGYSVEDLFLQEAVLDAVEDGLGEIADATSDLPVVLVVGAPLRKGSRVFNCAVVLHGGEVLGVVPKSMLPTYREFYERRWFASGEDQEGQVLDLLGGQVPFGPDLLFRAVDVPGLTLAVEICEDLWVPIPPSSSAALAGATVLANLYGSPITVARAEDRRLLVRAQSARCLAAYLYAAAGQGESSTDLSWDGQTMVYEAGELLGETERFPDGPRRTVADVDLVRIRQERMRQGTFDDNRHASQGVPGGFRTVDFELSPPRDDLGLRRRVERFPFVPDDAERLAQDCYEAYNIQVSALEQRLHAIGDPKIVIGVSGGLDSTHALIVAAKAMDRLGRPRSDILAFTLPGFATSTGTKTNATRLSDALGVTFEEIDIKPAAKLLLGDLGHPFARGEPAYDVTFENVQAGLRTDYLFRLANQRGGIVLGTGDLSELALGWCTYGVGDQMSHYAVNAGVPKTLMQHLIRWVASTDQFDAETNELLHAIVEQEISPELVPVGEDEKPQSTEDTIGPYALHDFTLFFVLRHGFAPSRIAFLARHAWADADAGDWPPGFGEDEHFSYDLAEIRRWMEVFLKRFFAFSQFKRSAIPNGPKVVAGGALSPRGEWRAPSDGNANAWLDELRRNVPTR